MLDIDTTSKREQRKFGVVMAIAFVVLGAIRWAIAREDPPVAFLYVAAPFLALALVAPAVLGPVLRAWLKFALVLNWVMTHVMLTVVWVFLITPTRVLIGLFGSDPLKREWSSEDSTYWEEPDEQPDDIEAYFRQF